MKTATDWARYEDTMIPAMLRELESSLADMVASGDLTDSEANEWMAAKADQWAGGLS